MPNGARFAVRFALIAGVLFGLYSFPYVACGISEAGFDRYLAGYARLTGWVLGWFEPGVRVTGTVISGRFSLEIVKSCDAMEDNILFLSAVFALPSPARRRAAAAALGLTLLVIANLARLVSLYFVGLYAPSAFEFFHIELWPLLLILLTVGAFVFIAQRLPAAASGAAA